MYNSLSSRKTAKGSEAKIFQCFALKIKGLFIPLYLENYLVALCVLHLNLYAAYLFKWMQLIKGFEILQIIEREMREQLFGQLSRFVFMRKTTNKMLI